ncbi:MAG: CpcT/CpeT family chromophore lyase [Rhodospirillaceae bacterium]|nr:CpcT/CpeT family chromophore lyase [Rhodospirillaceae bacterium]
MTLRSAFLACALGAVLAQPASATNSPIELKTALKTLMTWLPGQFDSEPQRFFEEEYKTPKDLVHGRVYRSFTKIDAPAIGENVLVGTVRYGGKDGQFDNGEFQVWTLGVDQARQAVKMSPRRFKDPARYVEIARDAEKLKGLTPDDLKPAEGAAGCDIWWRLSGKQLLGRTEPGACASMSTVLKTTLNWEWEYILNHEELWLTFAGRDASGKIVSGRPDQVPWRLGKARDFECFLSYRPAKGEAQVNNGFIMHDRGDITRVTFKDGRKARPMFMELIRGMWPSNSGRNYVDLLRLQVYEGKPEDPAEKHVLVGNSIGSAETDRVGFQGPELSGRCKLAAN